MQSINEKCIKKYQKSKTTQSHQYNVVCSIFDQLKIYVLKFHLSWFHHACSGILIFCHFSCTQPFQLTATQKCGYIRYMMSMFPKFLSYSAVCMSKRNKRTLNNTKQVKQLSIPILLVYLGKLIRSLWYADFNWKSVSIQNLIVMRPL